MLKRVKNYLNNRLYAGDVQRMIERGKIPDPSKSLERLKSMGFSPTLIFDVGAYQGDFTQTCLDLWPGATVHGFEAMPEKIPGLKERFRNRNVFIKEAIIGEKEEQTVPYYADETSSSVLKSQEFTPKKKITQQMITLDGYVRELGLSAPGFLKIDTQGYEYPILKGFEANLDKISAILLELNFIEIYEGVNLAHEVIQLLAGHGFVIYDICEIHRRPLDKALFQIDFIFIKEDSPFRQDKRWDKK